MSKDESKKLHVLAIIKGLNMRLQRSSPHPKRFRELEIYKICWVIGFKEKAAYQWKDIMNMPFLGMYATRSYRKVISKITQITRMDSVNLQILIDKASRYDPREFSIEQRLREVESFHPEIYKDDLFEKAYKFLYNYQKSKYYHIRPELIKNYLYEYFGIDQ